MTEEEKKEVLRKAIIVFEAFLDAQPGTDPTDYSIPGGGIISEHDRQIWRFYCDGSNVYDALVDELERKDGIRDEFLAACSALLNSLNKKTIIDIWTNKNR